MFNNVYDLFMFVVAKLSVLMGLSHEMTMLVIALFVAAAMVLLIGMLVGKPYSGHYYMEDGSQVKDWTPRKM
jgi:hypothetical protein